MKPYCELLVVHIQRGRRSEQPNGDIAHHCVGAGQTDTDGRELVGESRHSR